MTPKHSTQHEMKPIFIVSLKLNDEISNSNGKFDLVGLIVLVCCEGISKKSPKTVSLQVIRLSLGCFSFFQEYHVDSPA